MNLKVKLIPWSYDIKTNYSEKKILFSCLIAGLFPVMYLTEYISIVLFKKLAGPPSILVWWLMFAAIFVLFHRVVNIVYVKKKSFFYIYSVLIWSIFSIVILRHVISYIMLFSFGGTEEVKLSFNLPISHDIIVLILLVPILTTYLLDEYFTGSVDGTGSVYTLKILIIPLILALLPLVYSLLSVIFYYITTGEASFTHFTFYLKPGGVLFPILRVLWLTPVISVLIFIGVILYDRYQQ